MKTRFLRFSTNDGLFLQGLIYEPDTKTDKAILHIHGMAGNFYENRFLDSMARIFTDNGWAFFCPNTRGHDYIADFQTVNGEYKRIGDAYEIFEESVHDIKAALDVLEEEGFKTIALQGHSLGSPKVAYYLATTQDPRVSKLILASPADMVGLAEAEKNFETTMKMAQELMDQGKEREILPRPIFPEEGWDGYMLSAQTYVSLSKRNAPVDIISTYDKDKASLLGELKIPILAFFGSSDDAAILPLQEALDVIKRKSTHSPQFDTDIVEGAPHSYVGREDEVARLIINWLTR